MPITVGQLKRYIENEPDDNAVMIQLDGIYSEAIELCAYDQTLFIDGKATKLVS